MIGNVLPEQNPKKKKIDPEMSTYFVEICTNIQGCSW